MERPIYHLEGVVKHRAEVTTDFIGPLDLILHLLSKNKIEIQDIPIAGILEQYMTWVEARKHLDLEVASEFIAMASHLMYIKTRMLLSERDEEVVSEMEQLIASLEERRRHGHYAQIREVLPQLAERFSVGSNLYGKRPEAATTGRVWRYEHTGDDLVRAMSYLRTRRGRERPPSLSEFQGIVRREPYSVGKKAGQLIKTLLTGGKMKLKALLAGSESRSEVTAAFLALLELCRAGKIYVSGTPEDPDIWGKEQVRRG